MPKLWTETIEAHRREVREAILDTAAALVTEKGLRAVTMSQIAEQTGIGRATLYKYFSDVETILLAWFERQVSRHLAYLEDVRDRTDEPGQKLAAVLEAYAVIVHEHQGTELASFLHESAHVTQAQRQLQDLLAGLLKQAQNVGDVSNGVPAPELANFCVNAVEAARNLPSRAAVHRLVSLILAGLRTPVSPDHPDLQFGATD